MEDSHVISGHSESGVPVRLCWIQTSTGYTVRIFRADTDEKLVEVSGLQLGPALSTAVVRLEEVLT